MTADWISRSIIDCVYRACLTSDLWVWRCGINQLTRFLRINEAICPGRSRRRHPSGSHGWLESRFEGPDSSGFGAATPAPGGDTKSSELRRALPRRRQAGISRSTTMNANGVRYRVRVRRHKRRLRSPVAERCREMSRYDLRQIGALNLNPAQAPDHPPDAARSARRRAARRRELPRSPTPSKPSPPGSATAWTNSIPPSTS